MSTTEATWARSTDDKGRSIWRLQDSVYAVIRISLELFYVMNLATGRWLTELGEFQSLATAKAAAVAKPPREDILRDALELTRIALAIPHPATLGDAEVHQRILEERLCQALLMIGSVLDNRDPQFAMEYCREKLAENPAEGYRSSGLHVLR